MTTGLDGTGTPSERVWGVSVPTWAYALALVTALPIADDLLRMPVQVYDALGEIIDASHAPGLVETFRAATFNASYLRPFRIVQITALFDAAHGHYWLAYRGFHAALLVAVILLFIRALRVRSRSDLLPAAFALAVLTGIHTFRTMIQEAFPINHFLEIAAFVLVTVNLCQARPHLWRDAAALVTFCAAALTLESGLLVWVTAVTAWLAGWRGVSARGLVVMSLLVVGYFGLRMTVSGLPTLAERGSGYFFERLEPAEILARFGDDPWRFRLYNVVASFLSVPLAEPQGGIFGFTHALALGQIPTGTAIAVAASLVTTGLMLRCAAAPAAADSNPDFTRAMLWIFAAVLAASAAMSYAYTKDDIMSTAGVCYALAAYAAVRWWLDRAGSMRAPARAALMLAVAIAGLGWSVRSVGIHHLTRSAAFKTRNDWAYQPMVWKDEGRWPEAHAEQQLMEHLRSDALRMPVPNPRFQPAWMNQVWGE
jgi:hypothetical protein